MSKTFIIILAVIGFGVGTTAFQMWSQRNVIQDYENALKECGLSAGFTFDDELAKAQECACQNGDAMSCDFVNLNKQQQ